jgi:hypothetical protein
MRLANAVVHAPPPAQAGDGRLRIRFAERGAPCRFNRLLASL